MGWNFLVVLWCFETNPNKYEQWVRHSGLLTFLRMSKYCWYRVKYCIVLQGWLSIREAMPTPKSFALWRISLVSWSWTRHRRNGVRFPKYPHGCASRLRYSGPTFHFWTRWLVSWSWTRAHRADVHFNKHPHDLFQVPCGVCFQWFVPERSPSYPDFNISVILCEGVVIFGCYNRED